jgi:hypothetical protein
MSASRDLAEEALRWAGAHTGIDALLIVPPFGGVDRPNLGVHLLQAECPSSEFLGHMAA